MDDVRLLLAKNMKRGRELLGIPQLQLAERVGCSVSYIGDIEVGKKFPSAAMFSKIAKALGIRPFQLLLEDQADINVSESMIVIQRELEADMAEVIQEAQQKYQALIRPSK